MCSKNTLYISAAVCAGRRVVNLETALKGQRDVQSPAHHIYNNPDLHCRTQYQQLYKVLIYYLKQCITLCQIIHITLLVSTEMPNLVWNMDNACSRGLRVLYGYSLNMCKTFTVLLQCPWKALSQQADIWVSVCMTVDDHTKIRILIKSGFISVATRRKDF